MKCPRCGGELTLDHHRKYPIYMCYECGYIEKLVDGEKKNVESNFKHLKSLNFNEAVAFLHEGLGVDEVKIADWLIEEAK